MHNNTTFIGKRVDIFRIQYMHISILFFFIVGSTTVSFTRDGTGRRRNVRRCRGQTYCQGGDNIIIIILITISKEWFHKLETVRFVFDGFDNGVRKPRILMK